MTLDVHAASIVPAVPAKTPAVGAETAWVLPPTTALFVPVEAMVEDAAPVMDAPVAPVMVFEEPPLTMAFVAPWMAFEVPPTIALVVHEAVVARRCEEPPMQTL